MFRDECKRFGKNPGFRTWLRNLVTKDSQKEYFMVLVEVLFSRTRSSSKKISNSKLTFKKFWVLESTKKFSKRVLHTKPEIFPGHKKFSKRVLHTVACSTVFENSAPPSKSLP
jgi:hypothetical protein